MQIKIYKKDFLAVLAGPTSCSDRRTTIPILENVLIEATKEGTVIVTGTNLELAARCSVSADVKAPGSIALPAKRLINYVRSLPDAEISISVGANLWATLTCGRSKTRFAGMSPEAFPVVPAEQETVALRIQAQTFAGMIRSVEASISREETRFTLNGAQLEFQTGALAKMVSTDGHRMSLIEGEAKTGGVQLASILLPHNAMAAIKAHLEEGEVSVSTTENHIFFRLGNTLIVARKMAGNFPDYHRVIPNGSHTQTCSVDRAEFETTIKRVIQFSDERTLCVKFRFSTEDVTVQAARSDTGDSEEKIPATGSMTAPIEIGFNGQYILDMLSTVDEDQVTFQLKDATSSAIVCHGVGGKVILMPMRV